MNGSDIFFPVPLGKDLPLISETFDAPTSQTSTESSSSHLPSSNREIAAIISPTIPNDSPVNDRASPEVQVLDITDLTDPGVRVVSKFSIKDVDNKFHITIYGKRLSKRKTEDSSLLFLFLDAEKNSIKYKTEYLLDGRKRIFYEPTVIGNGPIKDFSFFLG
jgi:hypothetical protein